MKFSFASGGWIERLKMLFHLPLPNRALRLFPPEFTFRDPVHALVKQYRNQGNSCGLLLFYWEDFHRLFTSYPHEVTARLQKHIRDALLGLIPAFFKSNDIIGVRQYSGEDFCLFLKDEAGGRYEELQRQGLLLRRALETRLRESVPKEWSGSFSFGFGCYRMGQDIENTEAAIQSAYYYAHSIATRKLPAHFSALRDQVLDILKREQISVLAQPIMNLASGEIFGWEILTRGPRNSPLHTPGELFEMAFQADLLSKLEFLVIRKAVEEISLRGIREQVFLNVTPVTLCHPLFLHHMLETVKEFDNISSSQIVLEITERHAIRDFQYTGSVMAAFRAHGFRFAVDDAGAGYSSLQSISELIPDMIKIDRSVISNIDQASVKQSLLRALLHFADNINCQVIAEGVERKEEAAMLLQMQVQMVQGFYFARPQPLVTDHERSQQLKLVKERIDQDRRVHTA
ncbi:EAL domain-containing protein [Paenibacillus filicis]|uniref:EAL domain-containing protein n=1 Tax=Paenibacillus gyeongsangnamensis TaxID=3388067 RepID=A0ABT4QIM3_9BACL|nr:EAL domain-containing protein [Paenibacillus filicis]MCZ8516535.1 EAL domain-containing protein [Paenibacillus filicis]